MATSTLTLEIEITHPETGLTVDAQGLARAVARQVSFVSGVSEKRRGQKVATFGRTSTVPGVRVFIQSAAILTDRPAPVEPKAKVEAPTAAKKPAATRKASAARKGVSAAAKVAA